MQFEIQQFAINLAKDEGSKLHAEIQDVLAELGITSLDDRTKMSIPTLYGIFDTLYKAGLS